MLAWLFIMILCMIAEVATLGLTSIWFAGGALVAFIAACLGVDLWLQVGLFLVVSVLLLVFTRPIAAKYFNKDRLKTNAESVVGRQAVVTEDIDNVTECGTVTVSGQEWSARGVEGHVKISANTIVTVEAIEGVKLYVKPVENAEKE